MGCVRACRLGANRILCWLILGLSILVLSELCLLLMFDLSIFYLLLLSLSMFELSVFGMSMFELSVFGLSMLDPQIVMTIDPNENCQFSTN